MQAFAKNMFVLLRLAQEKPCSASWVFLSSAMVGRDNNSLHVLLLGQEPVVWLCDEMMKTKTAVAVVELQGVYHQKNRLASVIKQASASVT